jgi:hypothetical protein
VSTEPADNEASVMTFRDAAEFEAWLDAEVDLRVGVWLKIAKRGSGVPSLTADEAVDLETQCRVVTAASSNDHSRTPISSTAMTRQPVC